MKKKIDYNNLFFKIDDPIIKSFRLYDLLINLLNENESILDSSAMQIYLAKIIS